MNKINKYLTRENYPTKLRCF